MMNQHKMKKSQMVMLSALAVMALIAIFLVAIARMAVSSMDSGEAVHASRKIDYSARAGKDFAIKDFDRIRFIGSWKVKLEEAKAGGS